MMPNAAVDRVESLLDQVCAALSRWAEGRAPKPSECRHVWDVASRARAEARALRGEPTRDGISAALRREVMARADGKCRVCGEPATHVDHIVPVARYGPSTIDNLQALCARHNLAKGASL